LTFKELFLALASRFFLQLYYYCYNYFQIGEKRITKGNQLRKYTIWALQKLTYCNKGHKKGSAKTLSLSEIERILSRDLSEKPKNFSSYRKTPLLVPGVDSFSNPNSFVLNRLIAKSKQIFKGSTSPVLNRLDYRTLEYKAICI